MLNMILSLLTGLAAAAADCPKSVRAVFDVGSGSTKLNLSEVEICPERSRLIRVLDDRTSLDVPLEANKDASGAITEKGLDLAVEAVKALKEKALTEARQMVPGVKEVEFAAAGTHAYRTAKNQSALADRLRALGVTILPLTQEQEALAGFHAVQAPACTGRNLLVWDVGGGSMQLTVAGTEPKVTGLPLGAESFKQKLIRELALKRQPKCDVPSATPNPIGANYGKKAFALAEREARALPASLLKGGYCVTGIGGVHTKAVEAQITKNWERLRSCACTKPGCAHTSGQYTRKEVECLAHLLSTKSDCDAEIKGPYSTTNVSNLYLISGFMKAMHIEKVFTENVNMGHGLALDRKFLKFARQPVKE